MNGAICVWIPKGTHKYQTICCFSPPKGPELEDIRSIGFIYRNSRLELQSIDGKIHCFIGEITTSVEFYWLNPKTWFFLVEYHFRFGQSDPFNADKPPAIIH